MLEKRNVVILAHCRSSKKLAQNRYPLIDSMKSWKRVAMKYLPEMRKDIKSSINIYDMWLFLWIAFKEHYEHTPVNRDLIKRFYKFANWCVWDAESEEIANAAAINFYEYLPTIEAVRQDIPFNMVKEDFIGMKNLFRYNLSEEEFEQFFSDTIAKYS